MATRDSLLPDACGPEEGDATSAYPDTDGAYDAYPNTDDAYPNTDDAYPNTDGAYPDTDAQYGAAAPPAAEDSAYPDTDAQYGAAPPPAVAEEDDVEGLYGAALPPSVPAPAAAPAPPVAAPPAASSRRWAPPDWCKLPALHKPVLEAYEGGELKRTMPLDGRRFFLIGRNGAQADIVLADPSVSRAHVALINSSSAVFVQDLDSAHGSFLDTANRTLPVPQLGDKLDPAAAPTQLREGNTIRLGTCGATVLRIVGTEAQTVERWAPPAWAEAPARGARFEVRTNDVANPYLQHLQEEGADADELLPLTEKAVVFGRSAQLADVVIRDESVSRQHCAVVHAEGETFAIDLGSASGTTVDGVAIQKQKTVKLADGAVLVFGDCRATYTFRAAAEEAGTGKRKRK